MADTLDVITLAEGAAAVNVTTGGSYDTELAAYITAVSRMLDDRCGPIVNRTITNETHDTCGEIAITVREGQIASVSSVIEYTSDGTATTLTAESVSSKPASGYLIENAARPTRILRRSGGIAYQFPFRGNVVVTYVAGRAANTAAVDAVFKAAAKIALAEIWRYEKGTGNTPFVGSEGMVQVRPYALPRAAERLLGGELLAPAVA